MKYYILPVVVFILASLFVYFMPRPTEPKTPTFPMPATLQTSAENGPVNTPIDQSMNQKD
jgi:hypothetical protein